MPGFFDPFLEVWGRSSFGYKVFTITSMSVGLFLSGLGTGIMLIAMNEDDEHPPIEAEEKPYLQEYQDNDTLKRLWKECDMYERTLFPSISCPDSITTTLENVYLPEETIDSLRNSTTLFLLRPHEFTYGVLAQNMVPGILLYGAPGTGKTHLVRGVAKSCNASVLDVSPAELFRMYIGESEKAIKALFSLARKLHPCIIFIDEADALFRMRSDSDREWYRGIISQLLQEWDGFASDVSKWVLVILATNRPYDLDEAVLRRVPRKICVGLPSLKGREKILEIHLRDERLAEDVDLRSIAERTPDFTGSDLKNLCVVAAYRSIYEELPRWNTPPAAETVTDPKSAKTTMEAGQQSQRLLKASHFSLAMQEVSMSVSKDSLIRIRNFQDQNAKHLETGSTRKKLIPTQLGEQQMYLISHALRRN